MLTACRSQCDPLEVGWRKLKWLVKRVRDPHGLLSMHSSVTNGTGGSRENGENLFLCYLRVLLFNILILSCNRFALIDKVSVSDIEYGSASIWRVDR